jgi:hypothetical protein
MNFFLASLKSLEKGAGSGVGSGLLVRGTDSRIPHTKMSLIPNTGYFYTPYTRLNFKSGNLELESKVLATLTK